MSYKEKREFILTRINQTRREIFATQDERERQVLSLFLYDLKNTLLVLREVKALS